MEIVHTDVKVLRLGARSEHSLKEKKVVPRTPYHKIGNRMMARAFRDLSPKVVFGSFRNFTGKRRVQFRRIVFPRSWEGHIGILVPALFYYPSEGCAL